VAGCQIAQAEQIGSVDTVFKWLGPDHKIVVEAFDGTNLLRLSNLTAGQQQQAHRKLLVFHIVTIIKKYVDLNDNFVKL
jgi:hypothetical protein